MTWHWWTFTTTAGSPSARCIRTRRTRRRWPTCARAATSRSARGPSGSPHRGWRTKRKKCGECVPLSKRAGEIITLREVVEEVGADAVRFFFVGRAADSHMDFDIELAKRQSAGHPGAPVPAAHARTPGILPHAKERIPPFDDGDVSLLTHESEQALIRKMLQLPELVESVALSLEPHHLPYYALDLATGFHDFYEKGRVGSGA